MKAFSLVCLLSVIPVSAAASQAKWKATAVAPTGVSRLSKTVRTIEITGGDTMKFNLASIQASPGERLHVVLKSVGTHRRWRWRTTSSC
jgi:hypothetical protein